MPVTEDALEHLNIASVGQVTLSVSLPCRTSLNLPGTKTALTSAVVPTFGDVRRVHNFQNPVANANRLSFRETLGIQDGDVDVGRCARSAAS